MSAPFGQAIVPPSIRARRKKAMSFNFSTRAFQQAPHLPLHPFRRRQA
jgi:hypothetical protein